MNHYTIISQSLVWVSFPKLHTDFAWNHLTLPPTLFPSLPPSQEHYMQTAALLPLSIHQSNRSDRVWVETAFHCSYKCSEMTNAPADYKNINVERKSENHDACSHTQCSDIQQSLFCMSVDNSKKARGGSLLPQV